MCMSTREINKKVERYLELKPEFDKLKAEIDSIKELLKDELDELGETEITTNKFIISSQVTVKNVFDTTKFKKEHNKMYLDYVKQQTSRSFNASILTKKGSK